LPGRSDSPSATGTVTRGSRNTADDLPRPGRAGAARAAPAPSPCRPVNPFDEETTMTWPRWLRDRFAARRRTARKAPACRPRLSLEALEGREVPAAFTLGPASDFTVGSQPRAVAVGDFNRDGKLDLVTANAADGTVSVFLNSDPSQTSFRPAISSA